MLYPWEKQFVMDSEHPLLLLVSMPRMQGPDPSLPSPSLSNVFSVSNLEE